MVTIRLKGRVTETGDVEIHLPDDVHIPEGEIDVTIEVPAQEEDVTWTQEELDEALRFNPVPAKDLVTGGWEDMGITDSQAWVEEQRRKAAEEREWEQRPWTSEEIRELLKPNPKTGAEIASSPEVGAWADMGIVSGEAWVEENRRKEQERPWTLEEIRELTTPDPKTGAEIVALGHTGGWEHYGIEDSVEWVEEQRRKRRDHYTPSQNTED